MSLPLIINLDHIIDEFRGHLEFKLRSFRRFNALSGSTRFVLVKASGSNIEL